MKKKIVSAFLALSLAVCAVSGCASSGDKIKLGQLGISDEEASQVNVDFELQDGGKLAYSEFASKLEIQSFPSINELLMALDNDKEDAIALPGFVANYVIKTRDNLRAIRQSGKSAFRMALLPEKAELRDKINSAIEELRADETLKNLYIDYLLDCKTDLDEVQKIDGAETIRVAVTGDLPPLDYITADGKPSGFNVAIMNAISAKIGMNVEFVTVSADARVASLSSGKCDVVFWYQTSEGDIADTDKLVFTNSYFNAYRSYLVKAENCDKILKDMQLDSAQTVGVDREVIMSEKFH